MVRKLAAVGVGSLLALAALFVSNGAQAQDKFGSQGQMVFSADRLFGVSANSTTIKQEANGQTTETTNSTTGISLLWGNNAAGDNSVPVSAIPRLSFDYFVIDGLTVGGSLGYYTSSGTTKSGGVSSDLPNTSGFAFAPRVGYALMFTDMIGFWPRGGLTYWQGKSETVGTNKTTTTISGFDVNIEVPFVISPTPHFAFTVGPLLDLGLSGSYKQESGGQTLSPEPSIKHTNIGLVAGILGYL
jgi:hypothetical protein